MTILATDAMSHFLNQYGREGWELVTVVPVSTLQHTLYFKRQAK